MLAFFQVGPQVENGVVLADHFLGSKTSQPGKTLINFEVAAV